MPTIVLSPYNVLNFPEGGGHFWVYLQYALGLQQAGCDVYWLEAFRSRGNPTADEALLAPFRARLAQFGLGDRLILYRDGATNRAAQFCRPEPRKGRCHFRPGRSAAEFSLRHLPQIAGPFSPHRFGGH
jgi:hypothetical protein